MAEIAPGARRDNRREIAGFTVERVVAAVRGIEPGNLRIGNISPIGIDGGSIEVDRYLPGRPAHGIGAGDRGLALLRLTVYRRNGQPRYQAGYSRR